VNDVTSALSDASEIIDEAIVTACAPLVEGERSADWSAWEVDQSLRDVERLRSVDCCYDRPSIGVAYALWHHGARTQDALRIVLPMLERNGTRALSIVDLGCGTGATACAVLLAMDARRHMGCVVPEAVAVIGVDQSIFMTSVGSRVVDALRVRLHASEVATSFVASRWETVEVPTARTVITAGYLLDHSDREHADEVAARLEVLANRVDADEIVLSTVAIKRLLVEQVATKMADLEWAPLAGSLAEPLRGSGMTRCRGLRSRWYRNLGVRRDPPSYLEVVPRWCEGGPPVVRGLSRAPGRVGETLFPPPSDELELDPAQRAAAAPADGPTVIAGPAGSGKTLVLAERIARTVISPTAEPDLRILVTAFNKEIVMLLRRLVTDALRRRGAEVSVQGDDEPGRVTVDVRVHGRRATLSFYNRDKLPTRVFNVPRASAIQDSREWRRTISQRRQQLPADERHRLEGFSDGFLESEFVRFIVAKGRRDQRSYVAAGRPRSRRALGPRQKEAIWRLVMEPPIPSHGLQRLRAIQKGVPARPYSHIYVDECQDFGEAELRLLGSSALTPERLCVAGDPSQSIHLGQSYRRPTFQGRNWRPHHLEGSHRLPLRICQALRPLAERLIERGAVDVADETDAILLGPRKDSVLGVRPIVVLAEDLRQRLPTILDAYARAVEDHRLFVGDGRPWICSDVSLAAEGWDMTAGSMLEFKGCEWPIVVATDAWDESGRQEQGDADYIATLEQHVFTGLTRATRLLVIALSKPMYRFDPVSRFLGRIDRNRLLFWTEDASRRFDGLRALVDAQDRADAATTRLDA
jgi:hypothetical protein